MPGFGLFKPSVDRLERQKDAAGLVALLTETKDAAVAAQAVDALGRVGDPSAVPALIASAAHPALRPNALMALRCLGRPAFLPVMLDQRRERPAIDRKTAVGVLVDVGRFAPELPVAVLLAGTDAGSTTARSAADRLLAAEVLEAIVAPLPANLPPGLGELFDRLAADAHANDALLQAIGSDPDVLVRIAAARALAASGDARTGDAILALAGGDWRGLDCHDRDVSELRIDLCRVLLGLGDRRAERLLASECRWHDSATDLLVGAAREHRGLGPELEARLLASLREADAERDAASTTSHNSYQDQQAFYRRSDVARRLARIVAACGSAYTGEDETGSLVRRNGGF